MDDVVESRLGPVLRAKAGLSSLSTAAAAFRHSALALLVTEFFIGIGESLSVS